MNLEPYTGPKYPGWVDAEDLGPVYDEVAPVPDAVWDWTPTTKEGK